MTDKEPGLCPFCKHEPDLRSSNRWPDQNKAAVKGYTVVCTNIECPIYMADTQYYLTAEEAIDAWNQGALKMAHEVTMDAAGSPPYRKSNWIYNDCSWGCSRCGYPYGNKRIHPGFCPNCGAVIDSNPNSQSERFNDEGTMCV